MSLGGTAGPRCSRGSCGSLSATVRALEVKRVEAIFCGEVGLRCRNLGRAWEGCTGWKQVIHFCPCVHPSNWETRFRHGAEVRPLPSAISPDNHFHVSRRCGKRDLSACHQALTLLFLLLFAIYPGRSTARFNITYTSAIPCTPSSSQPHSKSSFTHSILVCLRIMSHPEPRSLAAAGTCHTRK